MMIIEHVQRFLFVLLTASIFILCDSLSAYWGKTGNIYSILIMFLFAPLGYILFGLLNRNESLSIASGLVNMAIIIGTITVGLVYFDDVLSIKQSIGLILAVLSILLLI